MPIVEPVTERIKERTRTTTYAAVVDYPTLYGWQHEALDGWRFNKRRGIVQAVTGSGKTRLGLAAAVDALKKGYKVLILVPTAELQGQWRRNVLEAIPAVRLGLLGGGHKSDFQSADVLIAIVNSAATRKLLKARRAGLVIADECHRYAAKNFAHALQDDFGWRLGLTATPKRPDGADTSVLAPYFGGRVYTYDYEQALDDRIIAPFDVALVGIDLTIGERAEYDDLSEKVAHLHPILEKEIRENRPLVKLRFIDAVTELAKDEIYGRAHSAAIQYLAAVQRRKMIAATAAAKIPMLMRLSSLFTQGMKTLVFGESVSSAVEAATSLASMGVKTTTVHSQLPDDQRRAALRGFRHNLTTVLTAPKVLDEGIDVPDAELAVILSSSRTERQVIQRLGRVIRRKPNGKPGRLVYFYARDTLEDPAMHAEFLPNILPYARATGTFDLPEQTPQLLRFLRRPADPEPEARTEPTPTWSSTSSPADDAVLWNPDEPIEQPERLTKSRPVTADPVKDYLKAIGKTPLLSAEEEVELAQQIEAGLYARHLLDDVTDRPRKEVRRLREVDLLGHQAMDHMVRANLRLVVSIAKRYRHTESMDFLDAVQHGNLGLIRAVQKFDFTHGTKFSTYATWWIRQAISRGIDDEDRMIRLPVHVEEDASKIEKAAAELRSQNRDDSVDAVAASTGMRPEKVEQIRRWTRRVWSLDSQITLDGQQYSVGEVLVDEEQPTVHDFAAKSAGRAQINSVLDTFTEREAGVLAMRVGLPDGNPKTLEAIGQVYGVTRERIRQIESKALKALREPEYRELLVDL